MWKTMKPGRIAAIGMVCLGVFLMAAVARAADDGPSFDCRKANSPSEKTICADPVLAKLDRELGKVFADAKRRTEDYRLVGEDVDATPAEWFRKNADTEWLYREQTCLDDVACLKCWYAKRLALLRWIAYSDDAYGGSGIESVVQLDDGSTLISYGMVTHRRNVLYDPQTGTFDHLADGDIEVVSSSPLLYRAAWSKGYFREGGAFWFNSIRDGDNRIIAIEAAEKNGAVCSSKAEFIERSFFSAEELALVASDRICITN